jgi:poly(A) polymerase
MSWLSRLWRRPKAPPKLEPSAFAPRPAGGILVGGALRDALLARAFTDLDWLVADPKQAAERAAFELQGSAFALDEARGHWRVVSSAKVRDYIRLNGSLETNLLSRDYTVNALAMLEDGTLVDPTGGLDDLTARRIRMVSRNNLASDPLRPLRGVRLAVQLGFALDEPTAEAIREHARAQREGLEPLPAWERIGDELNRLVRLAQAGYGMRLLAQLGFLDVYLPELAQTHGVQQGGYHHLDVLEHSLEALQQLVTLFPEADLSLRWATLLHDLGKPECKHFDEKGQYYHFHGHAQLGSELATRALRRLRQPSEYVKRVGGLVKYHMLPLPQSAKEARRFVHRRRELLPDLVKLMIADREAARGPLSSEAARRAYHTALREVQELLQAPKPPRPLLSGREVMALLGIDEGPKVGQAVRYLQEAEAVGDVKTREDAELALRRYAAEQGWRGSAG